jgi:F-type H+-transporting ATPase subunit c
MSEQSILSLASIITVGFTITLGTICPALAEGKAVIAGLDAIARQPEAASSISRTLFVGLAMVESMAIYVLVITLVLLFANPLLP